MHDTLEPEYRIVLGGQSRALRRTESRKVIQRQSHDLVIHLTKDGFANDRFFHWLGDLRRGQLRIYGALLRFIDLSVERGVPKKILDLIPAWISNYIADQYSGDDDPSSVRKAA